MSEKIELNDLDDHQREEHEEEAEKTLEGEKKTILCYLTQNIISIMTK